jgi:hypothetical protein
MDQNPYQTPHEPSAQPSAPAKGTTVLLPRDPVVIQEGICPCCGVYSINIRGFWVLDNVYCLFIFWWIQRRLYVACPTCMRKIIWRRCLANIVPGNLIWLFHSLPTTILFDFWSRLGPKRKVPETLVPFILLLIIAVIIAVLIGVVSAVVRLSN